jgi:solute carrier family 12 sodium/potassium/chloride transporter 2
LFFSFKAQIVLLAILIVAQVAFVIGSIMGPMDDSEKAKGFVGYSGKFQLYYDPVIYS